MSETTRYSPCADPGAADVMFVPNWTEHGDPGGVKLHDPEAVVKRKVGVEPPAEQRVKRLRAVDIRNGNDDRFELHVNPRDARIDTADYIRTHTLRSSRDGAFSTHESSNKLRDLIRRGIEREMA